MNRKCDEVEGALIVRAVLRAAGRERERERERLREEGTTCGCR